ncbi:Major intracellular serine protease [Cytospora mali]|uniref:Major intracellular serine protease n=1 Tax=Cytospora mali TaxID=578113 RepID=A0A194V779_CYTMA|nr:Major intracellular serine protease [Valsa mali var. pyri (nom. inval.)]
MSDNSKFQKRKKEVLEGRGGERADQSNDSKDSWQQQIERLLEIAKNIDFHDLSEDDKKSLRNNILNTSLDDQGRTVNRVFLELVRYPDRRSSGQGSIWLEKHTIDLLTWMLKDVQIQRFFNKHIEGPRDEISERLRLHLAIDKNHTGFLACFLGISEDHSLKRLKTGKIMESVEKMNNNKDNSLHLAIKTLHPYASYLARLCSKEALMAKDCNENTPLLLAMDTRHGEKKSVFPDKRYDRDRFTPIDVWNEVKAREDSTDILPELLRTTNADGYSHYSKRCKGFPDPDDDEKKLQQDLKDQIFRHVKCIPNVSMALYGTKDKELCLDMSDSNQSTHDFEKFIKKLTAPDIWTAQDDTGSSWRGLHFEETLFFVHLPDFNYVRLPRPNDGVGRLFAWLKEKGVHTIRRLHIPDSTTNPMSDEIVEDAILNKFTINDLDWRKLDLNLDVILRLESRKYVESLSLYSTGNWSILYHWISPDGLAKFPNLKKVQIAIIQLDPLEGLHGFQARKRHRGLSYKYKTDMEDMKKHNQEQANQVLEHLRDSFDFDDPEFEEYANYFRSLVTEPDPGDADNRIKVAIIDNGVDGIRASVKAMIAKGISYVAGGPYTPDQVETLPWWMVADPHGTHMASLVGQINQYCRLYIARVGKGRTDILIENAVKAINWALDQEVDIISISWVKYKDHPDLKQAIEKAYQNSKHKALVFCSTADEGAYSGAVWPAEYQEVLRVSATDKYGHLTPRATGLQDVDIQIPGENIEADGPTYMSIKEKTVSGSSVATALAAGVASRPSPCFEPSTAN